MDKLFVPFLPPWAETGLQPAFYDLESGTVLQQTARMYDKVNQLIRLFNQLSEETKTTVEEYIAKFTELKDFVDDYFDNLDVQEEINNKLDEMTEDGTLLNLILPYISGKHKVIFMPVSSDIDTNTASGDCTVIKTVTGKVIMIDTGATHSYDLIKAELDANGITKIDYLIISHFHGDHTSNIVNLDNDFDFTDATFYLQKHTNVPSDITVNSETEVLQVAALNNCTVVRPDSGDDVTIDDITITFFNCSASDITWLENNSTSLNDYSMCCYVDCGNNTLLFTGDLGLKGSQHCYDSGYLRKCDVVKIPHHGLTYGGGNPSDFNLAINPTYGICSVSQAYLDSVSLPNSESNVALQANGTKLFATYDEPIEVYLNTTEYDVHALFELYAKFNRSSSVTNIYVDKTYTGFSDGTSDKPFKTLAPAIAFAQIQRGTQTKINIVGTYNSTDDLRIMHTLGKIEIAGNATVSNLTIFDAKVVFDGSITAVSTAVAPVDISNSDVSFNELTINGEATGGTVGEGRGLRISNFSTVQCTTLTISNRSLAYVVYNESKLFVTTLAGSGNTYAYVANGSSIVEIGTADQATFATNAEYRNGYSRLLPKSKYVTFAYPSLKRIASGDDLDNYNTLGIYACISGGITSTLLNKPAGLQYAFNLEVKNLNSISNIQQIITSANLDHSTTGIYTRVYDDSNNVWSPWVTVIQGTE